MLAELRLLASARSHSHLLLTVVLAGDSGCRAFPHRRVPATWQTHACTPDARARDARGSTGLPEPCPPQAGAPTLMTGEVIAALSDHAQAICGP